MSPPNHERSPSITPTWSVSTPTRRGVKQLTQGDAEPGGKSWVTACCLSQTGAPQAQWLPITQTPRPEASGSPGPLPTPAPILPPSHPLLSISTPSCHLKPVVASRWPLPPCLCAPPPTPQPQFLKSRTDPVAVLINTLPSLPTGFTHSFIHHLTGNTSHSSGHQDTARSRTEPLSSATQIPGRRDGQ